MLRLTKRRRTLVAGKILDVANLVLAAVGIGAVIGEPAISGFTLPGAVAGWLIVLTAAILLEPSDE
jgi:hypothetical protein